MSRERWLARLSILLMAGGVAVLIAFAEVHSVALVLTGAAGACLQLAGAYWFLAYRGPRRWAAFVLAVLAPIAVLTLYALAHLLWVAAVSLALVLAGLAAARACMGTLRYRSAPERPARRPEHAFLIMNPRSGGGKVARFGLAEKARAAGARVALLEGPGTVDVAALARQAVADGADLLGVAGGDGTQALVAGIAAEHDLPFLCISAGTRNHFALDLGLDRDDPSRCLDALTDGIERRIDLGLIGGRTFVNNASFGAYAEIVRSPAYRDDKRGTTLQMLPDLLRSDGGGPHLVARAGAADIAGPQAVLVSNNPYQTGDIAGLGRRARLDAGALGVIAVTVTSAAEAIGLARRGRGRGLIMLSASEVTVDAVDAENAEGAGGAAGAAGASQKEIPVGIDGETVLMPAPVRCSVRPGALRVVLPRNRPGTRPSRRAFSWKRLARLAGFGRIDAAGEDPGGTR